MAQEFLKIFNPEKHYKLWFMLAPLTVSFSMMNSCNQQWWTSLHGWRGLIDSSWLLRETNHQTFFLLYITVDVTWYLTICNMLLISKESYHWGISVLMDIKKTWKGEGVWQKNVFCGIRKEGHCMLRNMKQFNNKHFIN